MRTRTFIRQVGALLRKDLRRELRTREVLTTTLSFSVMLMVIFAFAFYRDDQTVSIVFPGILWISILFTATLAITRTFDQERVSGCLRALALVPGTETSLYSAKLLINLVFVGLFQVILVPFLAISFDVDLLSRWVEWAASIAVCTLGFVALGTLVAAMLVHSHMRDVLLPLLLYPLSVPLVIAGVQIAVMLLEGGSPERVWGWIRVVAILDLVFCLMAQGLFGWVLSAIE